MIPGLNTFLEQFRGLFGKNYLIAGFYPALIFSVFSAWLASHLFPEVKAFLADISEKTPLDKGLSWLGIIFIVALGGYILWSLNSWFRELLEGRYLPQLIRQWLEAQQQNARGKILKNLDELRPDLVRFRKVAGLDPYEAVHDWQNNSVKTKLWINKIAEAKRVGEKIVNIGHAGKFAGLASTVNPELESIFGEMKESKDHRKRISYKQAVKAYKLLFKELVSAPSRNFATQQTEKLENIRSEFYGLSRYALIRTETEYERFWSEKFFRFPNESSTLGPTGLSNMSEIHRNYGQSRYGMEVDLIWPRMLKLVAEDEKFSTIVDEIKIKLDFAVAMTMVSALFALIWLVPVSLNSKSFLLVLMMPAVAFLSMVIFYLVALRAYRAFGEILRSAIDLFRFPLLTDFHIPLPENSAKEKETWAEVSKHIILGGTKEITYEHPK